MTYKGPTALLSPELARRVIEEALKKAKPEVNGSGAILITSDPAFASQQQTALYRIRISPENGRLQFLQGDLKKGKWQSSGLGQEQIVISDEGVLYVYEGEISLIKNLPQASEEQVFGEVSGARAAKYQWKKESQSKIYIVLGELEKTEETDAIKKIKEVLEKTISYIDNATLKNNLADNAVESLEEAMNLLAQNKLSSIQTPIEKDLGIVLSQAVDIIRHFAVTAEEAVRDLVWESDISVSPERFVGEAIQVPTFVGNLPDRRGLKTLGLKSFRFSDKGNRLIVRFLQNEKAGVDLHHGDIYAVVRSGQDKEIVFIKAQVAVLDTYEPLYVFDFPEKSKAFGFMKQMAQLQKWPDIFLRFYIHSEGVNSPVVTEKVREARQAVLDAAPASITDYDEDPEDPNKRTYYLNHALPIRECINRIEVPHGKRIARVLHYDQKMMQDVEIDVRQDITIPVNSPLIIILEDMSAAARLATRKIQPEGPKAGFFLFLTGTSETVRLNIQVRRSSTDGVVNVGSPLVYSVESWFDLEPLAGFLANSGIEHKNTDGETLPLVSDFISRRASEVGIKVAGARAAENELPSAAAKEFGVAGARFSQELKIFFNSDSIANQIQPNKPAYIAILENERPVLYLLVKSGDGLVTGQEVLSVEQKTGVSFIGVFDSKDREGIVQGFWNERQDKVQAAFSSDRQNDALPAVGLVTTVYKRAMNDKSTNEMPITNFEANVFTDSELDAAKRYNGAERQAALLDIASLFETRANRPNDKSVFVLKNIDLVKDEVIRNFILALIENKAYSPYFFKVSPERGGVKTQIHTGIYDPNNVSKDRLHIAIAPVSTSGAAPWAKALNLNRLTAGIFQNKGLIDKAGQLTTQDIPTIQEAINGYVSDFRKYFGDFSSSDLAQYLAGLGKSDLFLLKPIDIAYDLHIADLAAQLILRSA